MPDTTTALRRFARGKRIEIRALQTGDRRKRKRAKRILASCQRQSARELHVTFAGLGRELSKALEDGAIAARAAARAFFRPPYGSKSDVAL